MNFRGLMAVSALLLASCGGAEEEGVTGVAFETSLVPVVGEIRIHVEGEDEHSWLLDEDTNSVGTCGERGERIDSGRFVVKAKAGWEWSVELDAAECESFELHLGNTRSPLYSVMALNPDSLPVRVYLDDVLVGEVKTAISKEKVDWFYELGAVKGDMIELRRVIGEAAVQGEAVVFTGEPGVYLLRVEDSWGVHREEEIRLDERLMGQTVLG